MPWPKGTKRPPDAGRKKGTPNKRTGAIAERIALAPKHPIEVLIELLTDEDKGLRLSAAKELLQYEFPKRKAVELNATGYFRREVEGLDGSVDVYTNEPEDEDAV